jgi:hypothetical protein
MLNCLLLFKLINQTKKNYLTNKLNHEKRVGCVLYP